MKLAWPTDAHLNVLPDAFLSTLTDTEADAFVITGDIGEAQDAARRLNAIDDAAQRPAYFVPGNHDYFRSSTAGVRNAVRQPGAACPNLHGMPDGGVAAIAAETCRIGHDGRGGGRLIAPAQPCCSTISA